MQLANDARRKNGTRRAVCGTRREEDEWENGRMGEEEKERLKDEETK